MAKFELERFMEVYPKLREVLIDHARSFGLPEEEVSWFAENLDVNPLGGKCNRGMSVPDSVAILRGGDLDDKEYFQAAVLGWMTELLQAFFLVADDIMDSSITRRGRPCWHRQEGVGMIAINDSFMLESCIYVLLRKFFRHHPAYVEMIELFHDITFRTELGQLCDLLTAPEDRVNLKGFSMSKHHFIVVYKTAYYSFFLPVALSLLQLNLGGKENLKQAEDILILMGEYFQIQDDYLDNYGDPEAIGKIGTDIMDNKCSWLVNKALEAATPEQRLLLEKNYGRKDKPKEAVVKEVFDALGLDRKYREYEEWVVGEIKAKISLVDESKGMKKQVFETFLSKIYRRSK